MSNITFSQTQLDEFSAKLEGVLVNFTDDEQLLLGALIQRGAEGVREDAGEDVSGFTSFGLLLSPVRATTGPSSTGQGATNGLIIAVQPGDGSVKPGGMFALKF